jgi:hypothetical protein
MVRNLFDIFINLGKQRLVYWLKKLQIILFNLFYILFTIFHSYRYNDSVFQGIRTKQFLPVSSPESIPFATERLFGQCLQRSKIACWDTLKVIGSGPSIYLGSTVPHYHTCVNGEPLWHSGRMMRKLTKIKRSITT